MDTSESAKHTQYAQMFNVAVKYTTTKTAYEEGDGGQGHAQVSAIDGAEDGAEGGAEKGGHIRRSCKDMLKLLRAVAGSSCRMMSCSRWLIISSHCWSMESRTEWNTTSC